MSAVFTGVRTLACAILVGVVLTWMAASGGFAAQPGDPVAGGAFAEKVCAECHTVTVDGGPSPYRYAPRFADVAKQPSTTAISLRVFLRSTHDRMPDLVLTTEERDNLIAYILSLKTKQMQP